MSQPQDESLSGRGPEEMLPEKGDPFDQQNTDPSAVEEGKDDRAFMSEIDRHLDAVMAQGKREPHQPGSEADHGMSAHEDEVFDDEIGLPSEAPVMPGLEPAPSEPDDTGMDLSIEAEMAAMGSPDRRKKVVWRWAESLRGRIYKEIDNLSLARQMLDDLDHAREQLIQADLAEAERVLGEVEYRLHLSRRVRQWSTTLGPRLLMYEVGWTLVLLAAMAFLPGVAVNLVGNSASTASAASIRAAVGTMLWGGVGGSLAALIGLRQHMVRYQDFDRQWSMWYLANPLVGIVLGAFVYVIIRLGLSTIVPSTDGEFESVWLVYALGILAGTQQNAAYALIERLMQLFSTGRKAVKKR